MTAGHGWLPRSASVLCLAVATHSGRTPPPAGVCAATVNYCAELVPTPGYYRAAAVLELEPVPSPFEVMICTACSGVKPASFNSSKLRWSP